jgi:superfamily II DNA or RNA helicase
MRLSFDKGTIVLEGDYNVPHVKWDERRDQYRAKAHHYRDIIDYLNQSEIVYDDQVLDLIPSPHITSTLELRDYQKKAFSAWLQTENGVIIMPTGAGKTIVAIKIIEKMNTSAFIVVPTLDLIRQWRDQLKNAFSMAIGEYSGEKKDLQAITVSTYDSAYLNAEYFGNKFKLLIFDEVHHLASEGYRQIAEMFASPLRLGLTATYERPDGKHTYLKQIVGGKVYEIEPDVLSGTYLSEYDTKKIKVSFTEAEREEYEKTYTIFKNYLISRNINIRSSGGFQKIVMRSGRDPAARKALLARNKAEKMAFNSKKKIDKLGELLTEDKRTIIFTKYNSTVYEIARRFLIPCITHKTPKKEREQILTHFKDGTYSVIVSSNVLNEGIDVPDAEVGIILSGTGSSREYIQRLGRLLRPRKGKKALLYELITDETMEIKTSQRRKN